MFPTQDPSALTLDVVKSVLNESRYLSNYELELTACGINLLNFTPDLIAIIDGYLSKALPKIREGENTDRLLKKRNHAWLPKMLKLMQEKNSAFFAVGAAHLVGEDNVLDLLKTNGYTVTAVDDMIFN